jgi:wyosine [tRNA(Phe)-imidazoG37] synthetase (radical SAM superfamily)
MKKKKLKYIYGPVPSWRLGASFGIDLLSQKEKVCSFDCIYCQLGKTPTFSIKRQLYVPEEKIIRELEGLPLISIDFITLSGNGEPTLAKNLGHVLNAIRNIRQESIAVITNSSLMERDDVQEDLAWADFVIAKLDAFSQASLAKINRPLKGIQFNSIVEGITRFKKEFAGKLALQVMFIKDNIKQAEEIASIAKTISPDEVQINTPLRPCNVEPLGEEELIRIKGFFSGLNAISVYESRKKRVKSLSDKDTLKRRGKI